MTENKQYFKREWEEEYYIFNSQTISEKEFEEKFEDNEYDVFADCLTGDEVVDLLNKLYEENQALKRHIERSTLNKMRVEDVFDWAKYDKFYDNEEAIKSIDWIAKELGVDFE